MVGGGVVLKTLRIFGVLAAASLSGCSLLPGSGPSGDAVMTAGTPSESRPETAFALVEIDTNVVAALARHGAPGLRGSFGDYRPPASQPIGVGDTLQITLWEAASGGLFSSPAMERASPGSRSATIPDQTVGRDGSVTVPYAGRIQVAGRSQQEVEAAIVERLRGKAIEPQALVNVSRNVTNTATVTGEVTQGARVPLTLRGDRVMDVIAAAGGFRSPVHETFVSLTRGDRTARAPIQALLANPHENIFVRPGDVLTVERTPQTFTVAGATGANAVVPFDARGITLEEAIGKAGGLADQRADPSGLFVLRYEQTAAIAEYPTVSPLLASQRLTPVAYHLDMRNPAALFTARRFAMRDKDILYVSNAPVTEIAKAFQLVSMLTQPAIQGAAVGAAVK
ncbi:sugar transporter [Methylosinus sporium]|uniref:Sugar transporter n=3 Tax=Methylosinus sporium TaxID=428 RepID=A0A2U1SM53_METSR|nr:sugar transporter [Methylosinus sporium]